MARLNISIPDDLYLAAKKWRGQKNLSQICARALQEEIQAAESCRTGEGLLTPLRPPSQIERTLAGRFALAEAHVVGAPAAAGELREVLGQRAAAFLDRRICDDAMVAIGGGRQMWRMVHNLSPRAVRASLSALGFRETDPQILHVHPNTLVTLLWLLYSPKATAQLVAAASFDLLWRADLPPRDRPTYFVAGSCAPFVAGSPFAQLIGSEHTRNLLARHAAGDFAYVFFDAAGALIDPIDRRSVSGADCSLFSAQTLQDLSAREDARVVAVAGGAEKLPALRATIRNKLCNVVITDACTAEALLEDGG
ncbi:MAG TPA: sugar-binding domain-containing protein [Thermoanaerobaculia bacterium]|nr:sugar-binding domain-containing protein [Thermoanaerobaculia bacterium]